MTGKREEEEENYSARGECLLSIDKKANAHVEGSEMRRGSSLWCPLCVIPMTSCLHSEKGKEIHLSLIILSFRGVRSSIWERQGGKHGSLELIQEE